MSSFSHVLFDLDGTLLDTAPDMETAVQTLREEIGLEPIADGSLRCWTSHGARAMIEHGVPESPEHEREALRLKFLDIYAEMPSSQTRLFPVMEHIIDTLEKRQLTWGIVTNKPTRLTLPLLRDLKPACVICGDTLEKAKPHPEPLLEACRQLACQTSDVVYLGDAERDIQAAKAAGMASLSIGFGYIPPDDNPLAWGADWHVDDSEGLKDWFDAFFHAG